MQGNQSPRLRSSVVFSLLFAATLPVHAATYYIDAEIGNDAWSGKQLTAPGVGQSDGPWQSLGRVERTALAPGDTVRLRCGQRWAETLRVASSGTTTSPIRITSYPSGCADLPLIDGTMSIPARNWVGLGNNTYRTMFPFNLVENGGLKESIEKWTQWSTVGDATMSFNPSCPGNVGGCLEYLTASASWSAIASPTFPLVAPLPYVLKFSVYAPTAAQLIVMVRKGGPTNYDEIGLRYEFRGTGAWKSVSLPFNPTVSIGKARFDLYVSGSRTRAWLRDVRLEPGFNTPQRLMVGTRTIQPAHHPNWAGEPRDPQSIYLKNSADSDAVATNVGPGSTYLTMGSDVALPTGASITPGLRVHMRSEGWHIDRRRVTTVSGQRVYFDALTRYRFRQGWGYFFTGASWMVDSPDEWHFDPSARMLRVWMPDSANPGDRVTVSSLAIGIDVSGMSNVNVDSIAVRNARIGVMLNGATNVSASNLRVEDTEDEGISANGSLRCRIDGNRISRTGLDAVQGKGDSQPSAENLAVRGNSIVDSGVQRVDGEVVSLPAPSQAAINAGMNSTISQNRIEAAGYSGIRSHLSGTIQNNSVSLSCLSLNDCAGIYVDHDGSGSTIEGNLVRDSLGNSAGTMRPGSLSVGVYLDDGVSNVTVRSNTVRGGEYGIMIHNGHDNVLDSNTLFGTRLQGLWIPEDLNVRRAAGDVWNNTVKRNTFVPMNGNPAIVQSSIFGDVHDFATYEENVYVALLNPIVASESWPGGSSMYTFAQWQSAKTATGVARGLDINGRALTSLGYASYKILGGSVSPNGNLANGITGWTRWSEANPIAQLYQEISPVGPSLRIVSGATMSLLASPNFSVRSDQWYRVSFDAKTGAAGQIISLLLRRGGGGTAGYEWLVNGYSTFVGSTQWTRYSYLLKPTKTIVANDPNTDELGARLDFSRISPGQSLAVANLEMVPISSAEATLKVDMVTNASVSSTQSVDCPDKSTIPSLCNMYVRFSDGTPVSWPYNLPALGKEIIYTRDSTLVDTDKDGIADSQDRCAGSSVSVSVLSNGCAIGQTPQ